MRRHTISVALLLVLFAVPGNRAAFSAPESRTYQNTRKLLSAMDDVRSDSDELAALFKVGDERIQDLIRALEDPDSDVNLRAQMVIRYLGNAEGMKVLTEWYSKQPNEYPIAGPVPLPLSEWDYKFINMNLIDKPPQTWRERGVQYIHALAVDDSQQSKTVLDAMVKSASGVDENTFVGYAIKQVRMGQPRKILPMEKDLAKLVLDNAFFVSTQDHKQASARLLGLNGKKDKALVEVYINRGRLAEEWHHVVIRKCGQGWKFFSITPVAVS
jgi:HEAT repeat protein